MPVKTVPEALAALAQSYVDPTDSDPNLHVGKALFGIFPRGVHLKSAVDFNRFALLVQAQMNLVRYAQNMARGVGEPDSLNALSLNAQVLQHFDALINEATAALKSEHVRAAAAHNLGPEHPEPEGAAERLSANKPNGATPPAGFPSAVGPYGSYNVSPGQVRRETVHDQPAG